MTLVPSLSSLGEAGISRLLKNAHLPFDRLTALSGSALLTVLSKSKGKAEGRRFPHSLKISRPVTSLMIWFVPV